MNYLKEKYKQFLAFIIGFVVIGGVYAAIPDNVPSIAKEKMAMAYEQSSIKAKYKMQNASFIMEAVDENAMQTEIGDKTADKFTPEMTLRKWSDEVNFKIKYKHSEKEKDLKFELDGEKIKLKGKKIETHFYEMDNENYEFEIILLEKPDTNIVSFDIGTKGLNFYYQPELTQKEKDDGAERPENVISSYAVYHSTKSNHILGQKNYKSGKAFHIYRPKIIDNAGTEVWGKLNITDNLLTVEIPQEFLDTATYPIFHSAGLTFGCDPASPGGSNQGNNYNKGIFYKATPAASGTASKISIYLDSGFGSGLYTKGALWTSSDGVKVINGIGNEVEYGTAGPYWKDSVFSTEPSVNSAISYYVGCLVETNFHICYYDVGSAGDGGKETNNYDTPEDIDTGSIANSDYKFSVYCTYQESGGDEETTPVQSVIWFD